MKILKRLNQSGLSLIELTVAIALFSVIGLLSAQLMSNLYKIEGDSGSQASIEEIRTILISYLNNDNHWAATLNHPNNATVFSCIKNATDCSGAGGEFEIWDSSVPPVRIDFATLTTEGNLGITPTGIKCNTFSTSGNDQCPFKYVARWQAVCPVGQNLQVANGATSETYCRNPLIDVKVSLLFAPANIGKFPALNLDQMQIHIAKSQVGSDPQKLCTMLNGIYAGGVCTPAGQLDCTAVCGGAPAFVNGFNTDGTPNCDCAPTYPTITCPFGQVLLSYDAATGAAVCGNGVIPLLQSSGAINNPPLKGT